MEYLVASGHIVWLLNKTACSSPLEKCDAMFDAPLGDVFRKGTLDLFMGTVKRQNGTRKIRVRYVGLEEFACELRQANALGLR